MSFHIDMAGPARRNLEKLPLGIADAAVTFIYGDLAAAPFKVGKPLKGNMKPRYSAIRGDYRILYLINKRTNVVTIVKIDRRADVYRSG